MTEPEPDCEHCWDTGKTCSTGALGGAAWHCDNCIRGEHSRAMERMFWIAGFGGVLLALSFGWLILTMSCSDRCQTGGLNMYSCWPAHGCVCVGDGYLMRPPENFPTQVPKGG